MKLCTGIQNTVVFDFLYPERDGQWVAEGKGAK